MKKAKRIISSAVLGAMVLSSVSGFAASENAEFNLKEVKTVADVNRLVAMEEISAINANDAAVINTPVDFTGVTETEQDIAYNLFKTKDGVDKDEESKSKGAISRVTIRKQGNDYVFRIYTQTMHYNGAGADLTNIKFVNQQGNVEIQGQPSIETREGARKKLVGSKLEVPVYIDVTVKSDMVGRGPILGYENRIKVICQTNLNETLPFGELFPDAMINPTANLAFNF